MEIFREEVIKRVEEIAGHFLEGNGNGTASKVSKY